MLEVGCEVSEPMLGPAYLSVCLFPPPFLTPRVWNKSGRSGKQATKETRLTTSGKRSGPKISWIIYKHINNT